MFTKESLHKMLELNRKYLASSDSEEKKRLVAELISLVPEEVKSAQTETDIKIAAMHADIKQELAALATSTKAGDWQSYLNQLQVIQEKIATRATQLGVSLQGTDLEELRKLIDNEVRKN